MKYNNREIIKILRKNILFAKKHLNHEHTEEFLAETKGLIKGYEFAIILLKKDKESWEK